MKSAIYTPLANMAPLADMADYYPLNSANSALLRQDRHQREMADFRERGGTSRPPVALRPLHFSRFFYRTSPRVSRARGLGPARGA